MSAAGVLEFGAMGKAGVYIQVPFCQTKCTYCNFHTNIVSVGRFAPYAEAVCREICEHAALLRAAGVEWSEAQERAASEIVVVDTVYIGGGTPAFWSLRFCGHAACFARDVRLRLGRGDARGRPRNDRSGKAVQWAAAGIQRISLGTQSFVDEELKAAGRLHRREDIYRAVPILRDAGICNISFDLIAGLPKQTREAGARRSMNWSRCLPSTFPFT